VSRLRARCPACRTLTAVAVDAAYECHVCARTFAAALVRVPRACAGDPATSALALPLPEADVVRDGPLAGRLPVRPVVLGGCGCVHAAAVEALAAAHARVALGWLADEAHGRVVGSERELEARVLGCDGFYAALTLPPPSTAERLLERARDLAPVLGAGFGGGEDAKTAARLLGVLGLLSAH
jgi:hypothetical protein